MELCLCEFYAKAVQNCQFFSLGTTHHLKPRIAVPQDACILWKCNKANHQDLRQNKPILSVSEQQDNQSSCEEPLESKWIPVLPGVISQKYIYSLTGGWFLVVLIVVFFRGVNESKRLQSPF